MTPLNPDRSAAERGDPMLSWIGDYLELQRMVIDALSPEAIQRIIRHFENIWKEDRQIFVLGNGGSAANASHFATDLGKGSSDKMGKRFRILSLNDNVSWLTAIGNDYTYDDVFVRQLQNYARPGDLLLTMSVSGASPNVVKAVEWANQNDLVTMALVGGAGGKLAGLAHEVVVIESRHYGRVEDIGMTICHMISYWFMESPELVMRPSNQS